MFLLFLYCLQNTYLYSLFKRKGLIRKQNKLQLRAHFVRILCAPSAHRMRTECAPHNTTILSAIKNCKKSSKTMFPRTAVNSLSCGAYFLYPNVFM